MEYKGHQLNFCRDFDQLKNPEFIAQTTMDIQGRNLCIWKSNNEYYVAIA